MKSFISAMDGLPKVVKIILAIPFLDIIWVVYRLIRSLDSKNTWNCFSNCSYHFWYSIFMAN